MRRSELIVGFDSAWTDSPKQPGAICAAHTAAPTATMNRLAYRNRAEGEPLVVSKVTGRPGPGFYAALPGVDDEAERHRRELDGFGRTLGSNWRRISRRLIRRHD